MKPDTTLESVDVTNKYEYDRRGNRTKMIEAFGAPEVRTTLYTYDKLDRLKTVTGDSVAVLSSLTDLTATTNVAPLTQYNYDAAGNLIETIDPTGARTLYYYDGLGRQTVALNAEGVYSKWTYDANGNIASVRVYADKITLPGTAGGTPPSTGSSDYRETTYTYDGDNRLLTTNTSATRTGTYSTGSYVFKNTAGVALTVTNVYDSFGNVVAQQDARGNYVWYFYDKLGRKVAQVDQELYLTTYALNADGNVLTETRFSNKAAAPSVPPSATAPTVTPDSVKDRITNFTYDKNGRRLTEARSNVMVTTVTSGTVHPTASATATITYTYNQLGEVLSRQEATGDLTSYDYDRMGRQRRVLGAAFTDWNNTANVRDTTVMSYDGLNNLVSSVENGTRTTAYTYVKGRLDTMTDAGRPAAQLCLRRRRPRAGRPLYAPEVRRHQRPGSRRRALRCRRPRRLPVRRHQERRHLELRRHLEPALQPLWRSRGAGRQHRQRRSRRRDEVSGTLRLRQGGPGVEIHRG